MPPKKRGHGAAAAENSPAAKRTKIDTPSKGPATRTSARSTKKAETSRSSPRGKTASKSRGRSAAKSNAPAESNGISHLDSAKPKSKAKDQIKSDDDDGAEEGEEQYWLMKAEPDSRLEKGVDVAFSIDMLRDRKDPEPWDGVRNPVARNNMRAMRKGDLAFFYHSNCKKPGIVGIMEIVQEHSVDESAFDPKHPYYDPKSSRDNPKWECVHVKFVRKFDEQISLPRLRSFAKPGGVLEKMQVLVQSRLSVSSVKPKEWRFIMGLVDEDEEGDGQQET